MYMYHHCDILLCLIKEVDVKLDLIEKVNDFARDSEVEETYLRLALSYPMFYPF